jgi:hypothetical protein
MSSLYAQNSGFMGKRIVFNMGTAFSPAWLKPNFADNEKYQCKWYSFNYTLSPNVEFITWKMGTVGLAYHYFNTKYHYGGEEIVYRENHTNNNDIVYNYIGGIEDLKSHGFGIFYKQYMGQKAYAPMGSYFKLQFDGFFYKRINTYSDKTLVNDRLFAFKIEFGQDYLFFNILRLSTGVSLGVPFGGFKTMFFTYEKSENYYYSLNIHPMEEYVKGRILSHYWLGFTVSIGVIPF